MNITVKTEKTLTIASILSFIILILALVIAWNNPANGYESSIYQSTPIIYWIALTFCYGLSGCILCLNIRQYNLSSRLNIAGFFLAVIVTISFISLFIIRGHLIYCIYGDTGVHIANLMNAISSGHLSSVYPGTYIETIVLYFTTNIDLYSLLNYHVLIYSCIFVLGVYLVTKEISKNKYISLITAFIACLFPFGSAYYSTGSWTLSMYIPYQMTFFLFPIIIYIILKILNNKNNYKKMFALATIFCISLSLFHLFGALIIFIFILCLLATVIFFKIYQTKIAIIHVGSVLLTAGIFYIIWLSITSYFKSQIISITKLIFENGEVTRNNEYLTTMTDSIFSNYQIIDIIGFICRSYGLFILFCIIMLISLPFLFKAIKSSKNSGIYIAFYLFCICLCIIIIYSFIGTSSFQTGRVVPFITLGSIFITGYLLYHLITKNNNYCSKKSTITMCIALMLIICIGFLSIGSYYQAPHTLTTSNQETNAVLQDMDIFFYYGNHYYNMEGLWYYPYVYALAIYGTNIIKNGKSDVELKYGSQNYQSPPHHFNYPITNYLGDYYNKSTYLILNQKEVDIYNSRVIKSSISTFNKEDYNHLENDITVNKICDNYVDIYIIY